MTEAREASLATRLRLSVPANVTVRERNEWEAYLLVAGETVAHVRTKWSGRGLSRASEAWYIGSSPYLQFSKRSTWGMRWEHRCIKRKNLFQLMRELRPLLRVETDVERAKKAWREWEQRMCADLHHGIVTRDTYENIATAHALGVPLEEQDVEGIRLIRQQFNTDLARDLIFEMVAAGEEQLGAKEAASCTSTA